MSRILVIGGKGRLGAMIVRKWSGRHETISLARADLDISDLYSLDKTLKDIPFDIVVNSAALTNMDRCETDREEATIVNTFAAGVIARIAAERRARLIHISTDYVFDGKKETPYLESDEARPLSHYGQTKLEGEQAVLAASDLHVVARVSWVFGPDRSSFVDVIVERARMHDVVEAVSDKTSSPTSASDAADWLEAFISPDLPGGLFHACNAGACTWQEYAQYALDVVSRAGIPLQASKVSPIKLSAFDNFVAIRPPYTSMNTRRMTAVSGKIPRPWQEAVEDYILERYVP